MSTYREKLNDPRWQKKRLEVLNRDDFTCLACDSKKAQLHVHHCYYVSGREPWEYPMASMLTLCWKCHKDVDDDRGSTAWKMTQAWEAGACVENERIVFNIQHGGDVTGDFGALWSLRGWWSHHNPHVPFAECLNALGSAADENVIAPSLITELSKAASRKFIARGSVLVPLKETPSVGIVGDPDLIQGPIEDENERLFWALKAALYD